MPLFSFIYDGLKILDASAEIFEYENETIAYNKEEDSELSKHINSYPHASGYKIYERTTKKEKVTFPLYITKGNKESDDDDGVVTVRLSEKIEGVTIKSKEEFKVKYDTDYTLELELKCKEGNIFYVNFYAKDDDDDDWEIGGYTVNDKTGKLKNIHCGRIKVIYFTQDPRTFSKVEFNIYKAYISYNDSLTGDYGYNESDKHDCVTAVNRSLRKLFNDKTISAKANMDDQMQKMISLDYALDKLEIEFQDSTGKKTNGATNPQGFLNKKLTDTLNENLAGNLGYYFFGMSVMDGFHSVMIVVNKISNTEIKYNIFDQHGSVLNNTNSWYSHSETNQWLLEYVSYGSPTRSGENGKTTTTITQIKHKDEI